MPFFVLFAISKGAAILVIVLCVFCIIFCSIRTGVAMISPSYTLFYFINPWMFIKNQKFYLKIVKFRFEILKYVFEYGLYITKIFQNIDRMRIALSYIFVMKVIFQKIIFLCLNRFLIFQIIFWIRSIGLKNISKYRTYAQCLVLHISNERQYSKNNISVLILIFNFSNAILNTVCWSQK